LKTIIWTTTAARPSSGRLLEDQHVNWTVIGGPLSGQGLEDHYMETLLKNHHHQNTLRTIIWITNGGPSSGQLLDYHHLEKYREPSFEQ
jgi:hypothetical protein